MNDGETMSDGPIIVRYLRILQRQMEQPPATDYRRGAARYLRWAADDVEHRSTEELQGLCEREESNLQAIAAANEDPS